MKNKTLLTVILVLAVILFTASKYPKPNDYSFNIKRLEKSLKKFYYLNYYPSSGIDKSPYNNIRASDHEVTNLEYLIFLKDLQKQHQDSLYKKCLPDTLVWRDKIGYNEPMVEYYLRHPAYRLYPLVGVTFEQAKAYCKWLTNTYNNHPKRKYKEVKFKIPDWSQWYFAAGFKMDSPLPWYGNFAWDINFKPMCNVSNTNGSILSTFYTVPSIDYKPNTFGLYNMIGNVAEMVTYPMDFKKKEGGGYTHKDSLFIAGGSWKDSIETCYPQNFDKYKIRPPSDRIGFRVFMEIVEEK